MQLPQVTKPRCFLLYALASAGLKPADANRAINDLVADPGLPVVIFHDHFIGTPGGVAIFFATNGDERQAMLDGCQRHLTGWTTEIHPLIFSRSPAGFDEQIGYTLRAYRGIDWEALQREQRPSFGNPVREAETAAETDEEE